MTPEGIKQETIRLHTLLQPFYRERMGEYRQGDRMNYTYYPSQPHIFFVDAVDEKQRHINMDACIRLPLPIDPVNENRGLTGMIKHFTGIRKCTELKEPLYRVDWWTKNGPEHSVYGPTPELALLRALCKQEGVE